MVVRALVGVAVLAIALDGGGYSVVSRHSLAIVVWWVLLLGVVLGFLPRRPLGRSVLVVGALLGGFALLTAGSAFWAPSPEAAFLEFDRASLYLGLFALVALLADEDAAPLCDGLAAGICAVAAVALTSRLLPGLIATADVSAYLPRAETRLSYPVNYWNGLGVLVALAPPLLLRAAIAGRSPWSRGLALAPVPALAATLYLTSSRGAAVAAVVGMACWLALTRRRWRAAAPLAVAALGTAGAVAALVTHPAVVDGPLGSTAAASQGRRLALLIGALCLLTGVCYGVASRRVSQRPPFGRRTGLLLAGLGAVVLLAAVVAARPLERLDAFTRPPASVGTAGPEELGQHLLSAEGNGRWQFWGAAVDEFRSEPLLGGGAGSYESWWARHGTLPTFVQNAHSLYLETLGELGLVGFGLLVAALGAGLVAGIRGARRYEAAAAAAAVLLAYLVACGIDWLWELPAVSAIGIAALAAAASSTPAREPSPAVRRLAVPARLAAGAVAVAFVLSAGIPLLVRLQIERSQAAARAGDGAQALSEALAARDLQPWAASPYLQLALVYEQTGALGPARTSIRQALERSSRDWRLWLVESRIVTKGGAVGEAERSLCRAAELNPRSPLFATVGSQGAARLCHSTGKSS
jgi:O-Antigen ligase